MQCLFEGNINFCFQHTDTTHFIRLFYKEGKTELPCQYITHYTYIYIYVLAQCTLQAPRDATLNKQ